MEKTDYILRSLSKISKKRWEHYVINRIFHRLDDPEIEFICQQCIRKEDGKIYLADFFLPQLGIYLEVDEGHHASDEAKILDAKRKFDIAEVSGLHEERISVYDATISEINSRIDKFVDQIKTRKQAAIAAGEFPDWDYEQRFTARPHLENGYVSIGPRAAFRTQKDALNCFGYNKGHYQRAVWNLPSQVRDAIGLSGECMVWFPRLQKQEYWDNSLSEDGTIISEICKNSSKEYADVWDNRIVMARSRDELSQTLYRFVGVFKVISGYSTGSERRFRRVATHIKTYSANT